MPVTPPVTQATRLSRNLSPARPSAASCLQSLGASPPEINQRLPATQKRLIEAEEIAALALFLCQEEARGLTGEALTVSGGALW